MVSADDTTGALESAARAADEGWPTRVVGADDAGTADDGCTVIDLHSRHLPPGEAAARMTSVLVGGPQFLRVHKIDSTLRGNWPDEIAAAVGAGRRVLMVPAYPAAGRRCEGGVVTEHGVPLDRTAHVDDPLAPVRTSRPASLLADAVELASADALERWLAGAGPIAVADAVDDDQLADVVARAIEYEDVLVVGTAAVVGAAARALVVDRERPTMPAIAAPVLVVCGSLHPASRAQVAALLAAGAVHIEPAAAADGTFDLQVLVVTSPHERSGDPSVAAIDLAQRSRALIRAWRPGTVVLLGGETAAAVIDGQPVEVAGSLDVGVAIGTVELDGRSITMVAKPGAFGGPTTLVDLMAHVLQGRPT